MTKSLETLIVGPASFVFSWRWYLNFLLEADQQYKKMLSLQQIKKKVLVLLKYTITFKT